MNATFSPSATTVDVFDFVEVTIRLHQPIADPFRAVAVTGTLSSPGKELRAVDGFCDAQDGSVHRIRFMPMAPGPHAYTVAVGHGEAETSFEGVFEARDAGRRGLLRVDPAHPWHFRWSGTGEYFFWNATTAYALAGGDDDTIAAAIDRLAAKKVNRLRVALSPARVADAGRWFEPQVTIDETFTFLFGPWLCARPESVEDPGWDITRFDVAYWRKFERLLARARERDLIVSVIFFLDGRDPPNYPFDRGRSGDDPDEQRYYAYAMARLAAFSNVEWCVTNEWQLFRTDEWAEAMGGFLSERDPYGHLTSVHGHSKFPFRTSAWADFAMFQIWDEHGGYAPMLEKRQEQAATGRSMPQVNEEYGYEDHYPRGWGEGRTAPARSADTRRRLAWEITMAGCYQTTGESAANGLGGWSSGRGDDSMTMLDGYAHLVEFFSGFDWWKLEPRPDLAGGGMCLAEPGRRYVVYLPQGGRASLKATPGRYLASWYNPRTGETHRLPEVVFPGWACPAAPDSGDWVLHLERE